MEVSFPTQADRGSRHAIGRMHPGHAIRPAHTPSRGTEHLRSVGYELPNVAKGRSADFYLFEGRLQLRSLWWHDCSR